MIIVAVLCALAGLAGAPNQVEVTLDRDQVSVLRGEGFTMESRITNRGAETTAPLKAHLNVASLTGTVSVDPSDWAPDDIRDLPALAPGQTVTVYWELKAGDIGSFAVYVVLLPGQASGTATTSTPAFVEATGRDNLGPGGTVPLVLAIPVLLGSAAGLARWRFRLR